MTRVEEQPCDICFGRGYLVMRDNALGTMAMMKTCSCLRGRGMANTLQRGLELDVPERRGITWDVEPDGSVWICQAYLRRHP